MKTKISSFVLFASFTFIFIGCGEKAGPLSCAVDMVRYSEDMSAFSANQSQGNCEAVKKSIDKLHKSCTSFAPVDKAHMKSFKMIINVMIINNVI
jgi:hypothetical protein